MKEEKLRRKWRLYEGLTLIANGVVYRELNVQILWRKDRGYTAEQLSSIAGLIEMFPQASSLDIEPLWDAMEEPQCSRE